MSNLISESNQQRLSSLNKLQGNSNEQINKGFYQQKIQETVRSYLQQKLHTSFDKSQNLIKEIGENLRLRLKDLKLNRYKYIIQIYNGKQQNQGVSIVTKSYWDESRDILVAEQFLNESSFYFVIIYAVFVI